MVTACAAPAGYVSDNSDCDDDCVTCNPGRASDATCDGKDDDCDATPDDDASYVTYYKDCDEDGFAVTAGKQTLCKAPGASGGCNWITKEPKSATSTDCNDANADVKPDQSKFFETKIAGAPASRDFDYDCDGSEERKSIPANCPAAGPCATSGPTCLSGGAQPACGQDYTLTSAVYVSNGVGSTICLNAVSDTYKRSCQ